MSSPRKRRQSRPSSSPAELPDLPIPDLPDAGPFSGPAARGRVRRSPEALYCGAVKEINGTKNYTAVVCKNVVYRAGMNLRLRASGEDWIVRITSFFKRGKEPAFHGLWYYNRGQILDANILERRIAHPGLTLKESELEHELFPSSHDDANELSTVIGRCYVMEKKDWKSDYAEYPFLFFCSKIFNPFAGRLQPIKSYEMWVPDHSKDWEKAMKEQLKKGEKSTLDVPCKKEEKPSPRKRESTSHRTSTPRRSSSAGAETKLRTRPPLTKISAASPAHSTPATTVTSRSRRESKVVSPRLGRQTAAPRRRATPPGTVGLKPVTPPRNAKAAKSSIAALRLGSVTPPSAHPMSRATAEPSRKETTKSQDKPKSRERDTVAVPTSQAESQQTTRPAKASRSEEKDLEVMAEKVLGETQLADKPVLESPPKKAVRKTPRGISALESHRRNVNIPVQTQDASGEEMAMKNGGIEETSSPGASGELNGSQVVELDPDFLEGYRREQFTWDEMEEVLDVLGTPELSDDRPAESDKQLASALVKHALALTADEPIRKRVHTLEISRLMFEGIMPAARRSERRRAELTKHELESMFESAYLRAAKEPAS